MAGNRERQRRRARERYERQQEQRLLRRRKIRQRFGIGFGKGDPAEQLLAHGERQALGRVGEQLAVVRVDVCRDALRAAHRRDRPHVVYVTVREQHRDRLQPVAEKKLVYPLLCVLARVDNHALRTTGRRHHIAVGGESTRGKPSD